MRKLVNFVYNLTKSESFFKIFFLITGILFSICFAELDSKLLSRSRPFFYQLQPHCACLSPLCTDLGRYIFEMTTLDPLFNYYHFSLSTKMHFYLEPAHFSAEMHFKYDILLSALYYLFIILFNSFKIS